MMSIHRMKVLAALAGGSALIASVVVMLGNGGDDYRNNAGGSGDSSATGTYVQPAEKLMTVNATNAMSLGATTTTTLVETLMPVASPTVKATFFGSKG
jgi:hypothetical protein